MQQREGVILFSPSDLNAYLECEHLTMLELGVARHELARSEADNPQAELVRRKGEEHERTYFARLDREGKRVVTIGHGSENGDGSWDLERAALATEGAMRSGADIVFQAVLLDGDWRGFADFLECVPGESDLGDFHYEVSDTKLARHAKPAHIFQLCFYSQVLARIQGRAPEHMHLLLGDGSRASFAVADYEAYYRRIRDRFVDFIRNASQTYPWPVEHCSICEWLPRCEQQWRDDDHLVQVANIRRKQIERLIGSGIMTLEQLGEATAEPRPQRMEQETFDKLRHQAGLQLHHRRTSEHKVDQLPLEERRGFALMPAPAVGDVYFDIEGDPFYSSEGSLEYLFGVSFLEDGDLTYRAFWARDDHDEQRAFEELVDWIAERRLRFPDMHVYHYANYERAALQRLMQKHGTREDEIDDLLRSHVLVDLFQVVRQALRISVPSYSLKKVEELYFPPRETDVLGGDDSTVVFERWLETGDEGLLESIERYNQDDCDSTFGLHQWVVGLRPDIPWAKSPEDQTESEEGAEKRAAREEVQARLLAGAEEGDDRWLAAHLLDYHRLDAKPAWWEYFRRLTMDEQELCEDSAAIGAIRVDETVEPYPHKRSLVWELLFPAQDFKVGGDARDPKTEASPGSILEIDEVEGRIKLARGRQRQQDPLPEALVPGGPFRTWQQQDAVLRVARAFAEASDEFRAAQDVLTRARPRAALDAPPVEAALSLDSSYLFVQGPPGSGKTYTGAEMAIELMRQDRRVGVASLSHKAIHNFLDHVVRWAEWEGVRFRGLKKCSEWEATQYLGSDLIENSDDNADFEGDDHDLIAGTAWLFSREAVEVDTLFIDEAGQVALADALAMANAARNVVLLGDPNQLPQVSQGAQPASVRASVLEHLLGDETTVPADRGIFLPRTYRLRPELCEFISQTFYDGRLEPAEVCARRTLSHGVGIRFAEIAHRANRVSSTEEADWIAGEVQSLLESTYTDEDGETRAVTENDILVVAPYNAQVRCLRGRLPAAVRVGTVDKFQGQEAPAVFFSMTTSSGEDLPRGLEFLFSPNRLNVAISRAQCLAYVVASPQLCVANARTPGQMRLLNKVCRVAEVASANSA